jgi:membrane-associated phospholipid phosphatase
VLQRSPVVAAPQRAWRSWLRKDLPHWWFAAVTVLAGLYILLTLMVLAGSVFTEFDRYVYDLHLVPIGSRWRLPVQLWVFLGQRGPAMLIAGLYVAWRAHRLRSITPLVMYALAAVGFVGSVLAIKFLTGRVGPRYTDAAHTVWDGGNIFPSGHVTGTVIMYGLIAMVAPRVHRRLLATIAVILSITVGAGTTALNLHWASDVIGGWLNGCLVLLIIWAIAPAVRQWAINRWRRIVEWHRTGGGLTAATPDPSATPPFDTTALRQAGQDPTRR